MIRLHQYPGSWGVPSVSPFCIKVEAYLRMAGLPYEIVVERNSLHGPKGKMPFIEDDGRIIPDSSFIIDHLISKYGERIPPQSPEESATSMAFQRLFEDSLCWVILYSRWIDHPGWPMWRDGFVKFFPAPLGQVVVRFVRQTLHRQAKGHGMALHSRDEVYTIGRKDLRAISDFLGDKAYFGGARPVLLDATAYGFLATILWTGVETPLKEAAKTHANLEAYCQRFRSEYFGS
ncbi:glutathione S-transferase family protein [Pendulispora albinea]|uniref:Glutathione S-transferase family protein n=1 Tax=Pendulispora albinea TaxID=2741071 RepID=A0ABZ2LMS7_9BACT